MISPKVLSTAAAIVLALPLLVPNEGFAQERPVVGGAAARGGGAAVARPTFGGRVPGGGGMVTRAPVGGGAPQFGGASRPTYGGAVASGPRYSGGGWNGGSDRGYYRHRYGGDGFIPGAVAGAVIGGALASSSYGYYDPYYGQSYGYSDDGYYDDGAAAVAVAPAPAGDDSVGYCMQRYNSYDPASGTYLGYDGQRYPCP